MTKRRAHLFTNPLSKVPKMAATMDSLSILPYIPSNPLPPKGFCMYIVGKPGSGKTNLWVSMMLSKKPRYYRRFFDTTALASASLDTLPKKVTSGKEAVDEELQHLEIDDEVVFDVVKTMRDKSKIIGRNTNNLFIMDDVIKDINNSKTLSKVFLNRRHVTHDNELKGSGGLSVMIISQVYNLLPLQLRKNCDHVILFKTENKQEIDSIMRELMFDLDPTLAKQVMEFAWRDKFGFLTIKVGAPMDEKYYKNFDVIKF